VDTLNPDLKLHPIGASVRTLGTQLKMFHLVVVVIDPYTHESAWILDVAERILTNFANASCRVGWVVTSDEYDATAFLGPLAERHITFLDPDREFVSALGVDYLPALVHLDHAAEVANLAQGWDPAEWRDAADSIAEVMGWSSLTIPRTGDPVAFKGSPSKG
jgi:hypothetical protein